MKGQVYKFLFYSLTAGVFTSCSSSHGEKGQKFAVTENLETQEDRGEDGLFSFFSSKPAKVSAPELIEWVEDKDNGLVVEKDLGVYHFTLKYKPVAYEVVRDLKKLAPEKNEFEEAKKEYEGFQYFTFSIARNDGHQDLLKAGINSEQDFSKRVEYFSFKMQNELRLIAGKDSLPCKLFHFERNYGVSPHANFLLGFEDTGSIGNKTLIFDDNLLGTGRVKLTIDSDDLAKIPELTF